MELKQEDRKKLSRKASDLSPNAMDKANNEASLELSNVSSKKRKVSETTLSVSLDCSEKESDKEGEVILATEMDDAEEGGRYLAIIDRDEQGCEICAVKESHYDDKVIWKPTNAMHMKLETLPSDYVAVEHGGARHGDPIGIFPSLRKAIDAECIPGEERFVHTTKKGTFSYTSASRIFIEREVWDGHEERQEAAQQDRDYILSIFDTVVVYEANNLDLQIWMGECFFEE